MVCRCRKAEHGLLANRYFGYQATLHIAACTALCFGGLRQERSATWRCGANLYPLEDPVPCPIFGARMLFCPGLLIEPFGYTPAAMPVGSILGQGF